MMQFLLSILCLFCDIFNSFLQHALSESPLALCFHLKRLFGKQTQINSICARIYVWLIPSAKHSLLGKEGINIEIYLVSYLFISLVFLREAMALVSCHQIQLTQRDLLQREPFLSLTLIFTLEKPQIVQQIQVHQAIHKVIFQDLEVNQLIK